MIKHPYFDLEILEDAEISAVIGHHIRTRETLAQWPLSCVEKISADDGTAWILKSNHEPCDIEGHFYSAVSHPNIIKPTHIKTNSPYQTIIYPFVEAIPFSMVNLNKKRDTVAYFRDDFLPRLESIYQPGLPVYLKIDTEDTFLHAFRTMGLKLSQLVKSNKLSKVNSKDLELLSLIIESEIALIIATANVGLNHGDFSVDNIIFTKSQDFIFLDWQRPIYGSNFIDEYSFVKSRNFDPDPSAKLMGGLVQIYWLTDCSVNWYPAGIPTYDGQIKGLLSDVFNAYEALKINQINM